MASKGVAYLLWLFWLVGLGGIHRFYAGKPLSGLLWLLTWGFFGIGQVLDLLLIPNMIDEKNLKYIALHRNTQPVTQQVVVNIDNTPRRRKSKGLSKDLPPSTSSKNELVPILQLAQNKGGALTLVDVVIATGKPSSEAKALLKKCCDEELMEMNPSDSGAIIYKLIQ